MKSTVKAAPVVKVEYHADDFGLFPTQSQRILDCYRNGMLNGVSVMPNSEELARCMALLRPVQKDIAVTVHLNLIEGRSLCAPKDVSLLTDEDGIFKVSFGELLLHSFLPDRNAYRQQLKKELRAQIFAVKAFQAADAPVRLDGHAHYHMLPVVFDALIDVIREENLKVSYIRVPREYASLYIRHWKELQDLSPINLVKVLILNVLAARNQRRYTDYMDSLEQSVFLGVFLSGRMYRENVAPILPDAIRLAKKLNRGVEVLAHPGGVYEKEDIEKLTNADDLAFLTSDFRRREATMFEN